MSTFRLTPNFTIGEFAVSRTHPQLVEPVPDALGPNVVRLAVFQMQPLREAIGRAVTINSGYRPRALNDALGGSPTSQHTNAEAVDWTCANLRRVFEDVMLGRVGWDSRHVGQVIFYPARNFVHSALPSTRYPRPTFCLHWPERGHTYRVMENVAELRRLVP